MYASCVHDSNVEFDKDTPKASSKLTDEILSKLNQVFVDVTAGIKAATKIFDKASYMEGTPKFKSLTEELGKMLEKAHLVVGDVAFACKHRKFKSGAPLEIVQAQQLQKDAALALQSVIECGKSVRVLIPKES